MSLETYSEGLKPYPLEDAARFLSDAQSQLCTTINGVNVSQEDHAFSELINSPAGYAMIHTLDHHGINTINMPEFDVSNPREALVTVFEAGQTALNDNAIPPPDLRLYENAFETAAAHGIPSEDVLSDMEGRMPFGMQRDLLPDTSIAKIEGWRTFYCLQDVGREWIRCSNRWFL